MSGTAPTHTSFHAGHMRNITALFYIFTVSRITFIDHSNSQRLVYTRTTKELCATIPNNGHFDLTTPAHSVSSAYPAQYLLPHREAASADTSSASVVVLKQAIKETRRCR